MAKKITVNNMADKFGSTYKELANQENLEYMVELGISSGLKDKGFNSEDDIKKGLEAPAHETLLPMIARANLIATVQCRELLTKQCRLLEAILREAKR